MLISAGPFFCLVLSRREGISLTRNARVLSFFNNTFNKETIVDSVGNVFVSNPLHRVKSPLRLLRAVSLQINCELSAIMSDIRYFGREGTKLDIQKKIHRTGYVESA